MSEPVTPEPQGNQPAATATPELDPSKLSVPELNAILRTPRPAETDSEAPQPPVVVPAAKPATAEPPAATEPEPKPAEPATPPAETPEQKAAREAAEKDRELPDKLRPRLSNDEDIAIALIAKERNITIRQAARIYEQALDSQPKPQPQPTTPDPVIAIDKDIATKQGEIAELQKKISAATEAMETADALKLQEQLFDAKLAVRDLQSRKESELASREQVQQDAHTRAAAADFKTVVDRFPQLGDKTSPERQKFDAFIKQCSDNPEYQPIFDSPRWRSVLAREFAEANNLSPKSAKPAEPPAPVPAAPVTPKPPPAPVPRTAAAAKVLTTQDSPDARSTFEVTPETVIADVSKMTPKQIAQIMRAASKIAVK